MPPKKSFDQTFKKFAAKYFAQALLKLDAWFESTRGLTERKHGFFFERKVLDKKN
jgi:hypothetical protein